jgi:hypothetical protein
MATNGACRPSVQPARTPIPAGWRRWSHGNEADHFVSLLGVPRPPAVILIEECNHDADVGASSKRNGRA